MVQAVRLRLIFTNIGRNERQKIKSLGHPLPPASKKFQNSETFCNI